MIEADEIRRLLLAAFPDAEIDLGDLTGTKDHYQARVVSGAFRGKSPIEQHQMVYAALGDAMSGPIHALALKTYTPEAWQPAGGPAGPPRTPRGTGSGAGGRA
jgi:stress-induced morphogen